MEKPKTIKMAVKALWITVGLGILNVALEMIFPGLGALSLIAHGPFSLELIIGIMSILVTWAFLIWMIIKIRSGRNWARIVYTVVLGVGTAMALLGAASFSLSSLLSVSGGLELAMWVLQFYALYLIWTKPGSEWFRRRR